MKDIKFGTDGWRGLMDGKDFTMPKLRLVAQAICTYIKKSDQSGKGLVIGYDPRENSESFARACAEVASANGIVTFISQRPIPTPGTAYAIGVYNAAGALMITASHNPPSYNGIKFIPYYGGPATDEITAEIEKELLSLKEGQSEVKPFDNNPLVNIVNPIPEYVANLKEIIDFPLIEESGIKVITDPMHGAASGIIDKFFLDSAIDVLSIRENPDSQFGGDMPEPVAGHLQELISLCAKENRLGLALDGDADRFGVVDQNGTYIQANYALALIADYLVTVKNLGGAIARTVATTHLLDAIADKNNRKLIETKVGFKYLGQHMREEEVAFAGEESAGMSIGGHIPEKDGLLAVLLLCEISAYYKKPLSNILEDLFAKYGYYKNTRIDTEISNSEKKEVINHLKNLAPTEINGLKVKEIQNIDGLKIQLEDSSWVLIRPSGTEPKIRTYIEAPSEESFIKLENFAKELA